LPCETEIVWIGIEHFMSWISYTNVAIHEIRKVSKGDI